MLRKIAFMMLVLTLGLIMAVPAFAKGPPPRDEDGNRVRVVVYVTSQERYYDSIVGPDLPPNGPFQLLEMGPNGLQTEFGPGDPGYVGGRWMMDTDGDGKIDKWFSCPLLGPGHE
jgi:hypothetical protein